MAGRPKGQKPGIASSAGTSSLASTLFSGGRRSRAAGEGAADAVGASAMEQSSTDRRAVIIHGEPVSTFDPDLVAADASTTPDLDAREARQRTTRRPRVPNANRPGRRRGLTARSLTTALGPELSWRHTPTVTLTSNLLASTTPRPACRPPPSGGRCRGLSSTIVITGNWYASRSGDRGATWSFLDPSLSFPRTAGDSAATSSVTYLPAQRLWVWLL